MAGILLTPVAFFLALTSCGPPSPPKPKQPISKVSILVLDRFDEPLVGVEVDVMRSHEKSGWGDFQPWDDVADAITDAEGRVEFTDMREDDWADADSPNEMYTGRVRLDDATKKEYTLRVTKAWGVGVTNGSSKDFDNSVKSLFKIAEHRRDVREREFSSLEHYVSKGVISKSEANAFIRIMANNTGERGGSHINSRNRRLVITSYEDPIQWIPIED